MDLMELLKALAFGVVEGITEWLPVSSTGHMMLLNQFAALDVSASFYDTFIVVIQLGAIMAVIATFFRKLNPFGLRKTPQQRRSTWGIWAKVVVGSVPAAIVGFALDDWMERHVMNDPRLSFIVVAGALVAYGLAFIVMELVNRRRIEDARAPRGAHARCAGDDGECQRIRAFTWADEPERADSSEIISSVRTFDELSLPKALAIGVFQALAIVPGTSRSGAIILGSMLLGTTRTIATEFAFFLAIPIMFGWSLLKFIKHGFAYTQMEWAIFGVGVLTAFIVSLVSIRFLVSFVKKHDFTAFGVYRILIGLAVLGYFGWFLGGFWG
ncbi:undecaprenyl-diphosphate phosphatase [Eggerthellaceae bacterium zg-1084]|uniref:undecaprenyl-diphosphate phosphatase n=1 Tax=Berryella wangjianweii TaxID=2734634 RepID=UPI001552C266|nr:undecaprenyl-diphosphate phosphatase [Berryella wangjianweii]NPD30377.1 undecaprenyl-diphosphate phosphatase [Berryella wangjianweii]